MCDTMKGILFLKRAHEELKEVFVDSCSFLHFFRECNFLYSLITLFKLDKIKGTMLRVLDPGN